MSNVNIEHCRLDIDGKIRLADLAAFDHLGKGPHARADAAAWLAAFLIADKAEGQRGINADS